jgi:hypothetical protein
MSNIRVLLIRRVHLGRFALEVEVSRKLDNHTIELAGHKFFIPDGESCAIFDVVNFSHSELRKITESDR